MTDREHGLDSLVDRLKRVDDEALSSLSTQPAAQALFEEVTRMSKRRHQPSSRRRRLIIEVAVVAAVAVVVIAVLSVVDLSGGKGTGGTGGLSIVDKAVAALAHEQNAIVHVKVEGREADDGTSPITWTEESWNSTAAPYRARSIEPAPGGKMMDMVRDSTGFSQIYDKTTNIIYQPTFEPRPGASEAPTDGQGEQYREMILNLLQSGDAIVEGNETIAGRECVRIAATKDYGTDPSGKKYQTLYLIDAKTNNPVEWRVTRPGKEVTIRFVVYEELKPTDKNRALLDLKGLYPDAEVNTSLEDYRQALEIPAGE